MSAPNEGGRKPRASCREDHPNWHGGRCLSTSGYVLINVGKGHHLADVRGYASQQAR